MVLRVDDGVERTITPAFKSACGAQAGVDRFAEDTDRHERRDRLCLGDDALFTSPVQNGLISADICDQPLIGVLGRKDLHPQSSVYLMAVQPDLLGNVALEYETELLLALEANDLTLKFDAESSILYAGYKNINSCHWCFLLSFGCRREQDSMRISLGVTAVARDFNEGRMHGCYRFAVGGSGYP